MFLIVGTRYKFVRGLDAATTRRAWRTAWWTSCWRGWTARRAARAARCWRPPRAPTCSTPRCCAPAACSDTSAARCPTWWVREARVWTSCWRYPRTLGLSQTANIHVRFSGVSSRHPALVCEWQHLVVRDCASLHTTVWHCVSILGYHKRKCQRPWEQWHWCIPL